MQSIIVVGASAGGVESVVSLVRHLPATLNAAIFVVIHFPAQATSMMPYLLNRAGALTAKHAQDEEPIQAGHIYLAPPDWHLLVQEGKTRLTRGPHENRHRPAIDPLFRSAALAYGNRVAGVLLSGLQDDGTAGLQAIKSCGGITICQEPAEASYPDMPRNAIEQVGVTHVLPLAEIAEVLIAFAQSNGTQPAQEIAEATATPAERIRQETEIAALNWNVLESTLPPGDHSPFACPTCGGVLWEVKDGEMVRYRCRVGHAFAQHELLLSQENQVENALWTALRALEERAHLLHRMGDRATAANRPHAARHLRTQEAEAYQRADLLHKVLMSGGLATLNTNLETENMLPHAENEGGHPNKS